MKINLKIWEASQRLILLDYEMGRDCGFDDTSDLYDFLVEEVPSHQVDNFHEMVCRDDTIMLGDCYVDSEYNVFKVLECDVEREYLKLGVNGSQFGQESNLSDGADHILKNFKLIKLEEYYNYLDIIWVCKEGLFFDVKHIKRIDFPTTA